MSTPTKSTGIPDELVAQMQEAAHRAARGIRDPEAMREAIESLNRLRQEIHERHGLLNIAVPSIRELRDQ
jgi:hypothetical protein